MSLATNNVECYFRLQVFGYGCIFSGELPIYNLCSVYIELSFLIYLLLELLYVSWILYSFCFYELSAFFTLNLVIHLVFIFGFSVTVHIFSWFVLLSPSHSKFPEMQASVSKHLFLCSVFYCVDMFVLIF